MLETIRQFAEEQLVARGEASEIRAAHSRYFAGREAHIMALWDSSRQREAYDWFTIELANLRTAFRWAADQGDLDVAAPIATYLAWVGFLTENYEPIAWAEELVEPARAIDHRGSRRCMWWRRCVTWPDGSIRLFGTPTRLTGKYVR
jgi:predicted ATPase